VTACAPILTAFFGAERATSRLQPVADALLSTHHAIPNDTTSAIDMALVGLGVVVVILTTFYALRYLIRPGETSADHIKRRILADEHKTFR
jgi:hypothetical protein